jgi:hypothetical protein
MPLPGVSSIYPFRLKCGLRSNRNYLLLFADPAAKFYGISSLSTLTSSPTSNAKTYEDMLDADPASVAEAAEIAAAGGLTGEEYSRVRSETFDNPIYDQPTLPRRKKSGSAGSIGTGELDSKLGSITSMRSFSISSSQNYSPPSRGMVAGSSPQHDYEDIKTKFDEIPMLSSSFRGGSAQHMSQSGEVDKLTVINESYVSLPCSGNSSLNYFQHPRPQAASSPNCAVTDRHRLAGRPIITEVSISDALGKRKIKRVGSKPSTNCPTECSDDLGANSCDVLGMDIETTEQ